MIEKKIFIEYRESGALVDPFSVTLASQDDTFGIKRYDTAEVIVASGTATVNESVGRYSYTTDLDEGVTYVVSWRVVANSGDDPKFVVQHVGPFQSGSTIRAAANTRGTFRQGTTAILFLQISDLDGDARDPELITIQILDSDNNVIESTIPEKIANGYYVYDWEIDTAQEGGKYIIKWTYDVDDETLIETQEVFVAESIEAGDHMYSPRIQEMRMALTYMLKYPQTIPVRNEQPNPTKDRRTFAFTFPRWNQSSGVRVFVNRLIQTEGFEVDYFKGRVTFENPLTKFDTVTATYTFRWYSDEELDRFLSNGIHLLNSFPPGDPQYSLMSVPDRFIPTVLYGAAVDGLRNLMLSLQFQEPQLVFGGAEAASKIYGNLEGLKKNYEETWTKLLEQKKFIQPYVGLTRTIVTPEFALPGGRSRWFRYMFSSGS